MRGRGSPVRLPPWAPGLRIGLYGGSFDPPHLGHRHVALTAMRRLGLDRVWWIVSPGNPLKDHGRLASAAERLAATRRVAQHPRMAVTPFEIEIGSHYTADTLRFLARRAPGARFVWIMGADSFAGFARWRNWRQIAALMPIAVVDRPGWTLKATGGPAALALAGRRVPDREAASLVRSVPPAWCLVYGPRSDLSSTTIRDELSANGGQH